MDTPVDRNRRGDSEALSLAQKRGAILFNSHEGGAACHHCHNGLTFTNDVKHERAPFGEIVYTNVGLYNVVGTGAYPPGNVGLYEHSALPGDRGKFRTPSLRNVALTGRYMHDGSVETLDAVMAIYQRGGRIITEGPLAGDGRDNPIKDSGLNGMTLDAKQLADLRAFSDALTDEAFVQDPRFSNPELGSAFFGE